MLNYKSLLTVQPLNTQGTRVTKVVKTAYGYRVQMFNNYITLFYVKLVVNSNGSAKAHYLVKKNYCDDKRYTIYFGIDGNEVTRKEYTALNK